GCSLVFYDAFLRQMSLTGIGYAIIAMTVFSFYLIFIQKSIKNINPLTFSFYVILTTAISFIILSNPTKFPPLTPEKIFIALGIALIPTFIAVTLLYIAIERIGSIYVSIFSTIEPIVTITASYILLKENVVILQIIGMISILLGIILPNYKKMVKNV
ncbi:MAG: DMT family transporter, partial [Deferribacterales bacterium]